MAKPDTNPVGSGVSVRKPVTPTRRATNPTSNTPKPSSPLVLTKTGDDSPRSSSPIVRKTVERPVSRSIPLDRKKEDDRKDANPLIPGSDDSSKDKSVEDIKAAIRAKAAEQQKNNRPIRVARRNPPTQPMTVKPKADQETRPASTTVRPVSDNDRSRVVASWPKRHTIKSGDTLSQISAKYYGTSRRVDLILKANPEIKGPRSLRIGRALVIPQPEGESSSVVRLAGLNDTPAPRRSITRRRSSSPVVVASRRSYTVEKGDTFYKIARKVYGSTARWKELFEANKSVVSNPSKLKPGMVLKIPS